MCSWVSAKKGLILGSLNDRMISRDLRDDDWHRITEAGLRLRGARLHIVDDGQSTLADLRALLAQYRAWEAKHDDVTVTAYIHGRSLPGSILERVRAMRGEA